jgi:hypothetical protein
VIELRFHRDLYAGTAVDAAVAAFREVAECRLREQPDHWVVEVTALGEAPAAEVAAELANYALGLTIEQRCVPAAW